MIPEIKKTNLRDGDVLVFRCTEEISTESLQRLQRSVKDWCRVARKELGVRITAIILSDDLNLEAWSTERLEHLGRAISDATASRTKKGKP